jgi:hypothetical protein
MRLNIKIFVLLTAGIVLASCTSSDTLKFDSANIKVGQQIGEMIVMSVEPPENAYPEWTPKNDEVAVYFKGQITVSGNYDYVGTNEIRLYPDKESLKKLPKLDFGKDQSYFVLADTEDNRNTFAPVGSKGIATLKIDNYSIWSVKNLGITNRADVISVDYKK